MAGASPFNSNEDLFMGRREFATLLPALLAESALLPASAEGQSDASAKSLPLIE